MNASGRMCTTARSTHISIDSIRFGAVEMVKISDRQMIVYVSMWSVWLYNGF